MSENSRISTSKAPKALGLYPHARKVGNLLFLSGVGPRVAGSDATDSEVPGLKLDKSGNFIEFDFEAQCRSVFDNVRIILEESGSSWDKLVDVTVFLVHMKRDFHTYNRLYAEYFKDNCPCRTTVEVTCLPSPIAIELKCIATID
jgi:2-aminomuconate deaminase